MKNETRFERAIPKIAIFAAIPSVAFVVAGRHDLILPFLIGVALGTLIISFIVD